MKILSIETSCDETGIAILEQKGGSDPLVLLGNALASQIALHAQYGGVFPAMAKRAHAEKVVPLLKAACADAQLLHAQGSTLGTDMYQAILDICQREDEMVSGFVELFNAYEKPDIDYIAVTVGPGLEPALWVGINAAKVLSTVWNIPVIAVNHMEGHVVTAAVTETTADNKKDYHFQHLQFPLLALLVSGGHTELVLTHAYGQYEKIGQTRDDAVGEAFDKVARMIGLPYPGGPAVSKLAKEFREKINNNPFVLPRPMLHSGDYDFSYSGIKTAVLYTIRDLVASDATAPRELTDDEKLALAAAFEDAAIEVLVKKTLKAVEEFHIQTVVVGGGVAGNTYLRSQLTEAVQKNFPNTVVLFPEPWLATDNAVMIGLAAFARMQSGKTFQTQDAMTLKANGNLSIATQ
jgi:N6-L-threonylcarbamoyladenine synthase